MTDLPHHAYRVSAVRAEAGGLPRQLLPYVCVLLAGATGLYIGRAAGGDSAGYEDKLLMLLRFMAVMKLAGVLLAGALTQWRFRSPISRPLAVTYLGALALMACAAGLIWSLGAIALGAVLFHVGLLGFLVLAWKDDDALLPSKLRARRGRR